MTAETLPVTGKWLTLVGLLITYTIVWSIIMYLENLMLALAKFQRPPKLNVGQIHCGKIQSLLEGRSCSVFCCYCFYFLFFPTVCMLISEWNKVWKNEGNRSPARNRRPYKFSRRVKQEPKKAVWSSSRPSQEKEPNTYWTFWGYEWVWVSLVSNCTLKVKFIQI